ncbi:MAG TPA: ABC transporter permease [Mesorhizobium sp.]|jgi:spermidine/putrescine transport system permease protein|nr:ABC transporter permease [Mesorhizobium sp.]
MRSRPDLLALYGVAYVLFLYGPLLLIPIFSFNDSIYVAFPLNGFTVRWYEELFANRVMLRAAWNSLMLAAAVSVVSTAVGLLAARALTRYRVSGRSFLLGMISVPLVVPGIVFGIALLILFRRFLGVELSLYTVGAGHLLLCVPFATLTLLSRMESFDLSLEEASHNLGENAWHTFWRVTFPLARPGVLASLLLTFTVCFDEVVLAFFLSGTEQTLPIYIYSQLRFPQRLPSVLALGTCILAVSIALIALAEWLRRGGGRHAQDGGQNA